MLEIYIAEISALIAALTLEQELLLCSGAFLSLALALIRVRNRRIDKLGAVGQTVQESLNLDAVKVQQEITADLTSETTQIAEINFSQGLVKSKSYLLSRLTSWLSSNQNINESSALTLEEILISADLGVKTSQKVVANVLAQAKLKKNNDLKTLLKNELIKILSSELSPEIDLALHKPTIILIVGVNGVGKTTTIAKISRLLKAQNKKILVAAADTFRAAAVQQLNHWANRIGVEIEYKEGENIKPATIVFDAIVRLKKDNHDVLIIDTAGRLHNRVNLMNELEAIKKNIQKEFPEAPHEVLLVLDGSSGQNALQQAIEFNQRTPLTGIIITKLDGTSKGGIVVAIKDELGVPIRYVGLGEGEFDLKVFDPVDFVDAILGDESESLALGIEEPQSELSTEDVNIERRVVRKRKESNGQH